MNIMICCLRPRTKEEELELSNKKLKAMYEMQKEFTSTVSHELRTPLASIKMAIDLVVRKMVGTINREQKEVLGRAKKNVDRLKRLIDDILDLTKIESGKLQMNFMVNDIHQFIQETVESQKDVANSRGLYIKIEFDPNLPQVPFDSDRIIQVLNNLLNNAIKFTKTGRHYNNDAGIKQKQSYSCQLSLTREKGLRHQGCPKFLKNFSKLNPQK